MPQFLSIANIDNSRRNKLTIFYEKSFCDLQYFEERTPALRVTKGAKKTVQMTLRLNKPECNIWVNGKLFHKPVFEENQERRIDISKNVHVIFVLK